MRGCLDGMEVITDDLKFHSRCLDKKKGEGRVMF